METVTDSLFMGSKITADGECSHEIKRHLLLGRKGMTNPDSILKSRDITLPTKVHLVKAMVFPVVIYGCESWTWRKLLLLLSHFSRVRLFATPWTTVYQAPPSMGFSRQEYWSRLPLPSPVYSSIIHNSLKLVTHQISIIRERNKFRKSIKWKALLE